MGSYGFAMAVHYLGVNIWVGLLSAVLVSAVFSYLMGLLVTRFGSHYFVVFTIVISMILFFLFMNLREYTGGDMGIILKLRTVPLGFVDLPLRNPFVKYYLVLGVAGIALYAVLRFFNSPLGRAIEAVKENEERAAVIGYNTKQLKLISFTISGVVSGLAGGLYPIIYNSTNAELFFWIFSGKAVLWTVVGGVGTLWGSFLGAGILVYTEDMLSSWLVDYYHILVGVLLIVIILLAPKGIVGSIQNYWRESKASE
jgi:branched-chain amino acid transport system permease protein